MTYNPKAVDALLDALGEDGVLWFVEKSPHVAAAYNALRPKPNKFPVMPTFEDLAHDKTLGGVPCIKFKLGITWTNIFKGEYDGLRELTATDIPMVHIPAAEDWNDEIIDALREECPGINIHTPNSAVRAFIMAFKAKLEKPNE